MVDTKVIESEYEDAPYFSKEFLDWLKDKFDIRKSVWWEQDLGILKGTQNVLTFLENAYEYSYNKSSSEIEED